MATSFRRGGKSIMKIKLVFLLVMFVGGDQKCSEKDKSFVAKTTLQIKLYQPKYYFCKSE